MTLTAVGCPYTFTGLIFEFESNFDWERSTIKMQMEYHHILFLQTKATLDSHRIPVLKDVLHLRTGAYKEEYQDGFGGWHIERGAPAKPIGCIHLEIGCNSKREIIAIPTIITK